MVMYHNGERWIGAKIQSVLRWVKLKIKKLHKDRCDLRGNFVRTPSSPIPLGMEVFCKPPGSPRGLFFEMPAACKASSAVISHSTFQASAERRRNVQCLQARPRGDRVQTALVAVPIRPLDGYNRRLRRRSRCIRLQIDDEAATTHSKSHERMPKRDNRSQAEHAQGHDGLDTHDTPHATTPGQVACGQCTPRSNVGASCIRRRQVRCRSRVCIEMLTWPRGPWRERKSASTKVQLLISLMARSFPYHCHRQINANQDAGRRQTNSGPACPRKGVSKCSPLSNTEQKQPNSMHSSPTHRVRPTKRVSFAI